MADEKDKRTEFVTALREFAELIEQRPDLPVPWGSLSFSGFLNEVVDDKSQQRHVLATITREFTARARLTNQKLPLEKVNGEWHIGVKIISNQLVNYTVYANKDSTCRQVTKMRFVPEQRIPAQPAVPEQVIPAHEESYEDWECSPILQSPLEPAEAETEENALTAEAAYSENVSTPEAKKGYDRAPSS